MSSYIKLNFSDSYNNYLVKCDLINKYSLADVYNFPKVEKIILEFPLQELLKTDSSNQLEIDDNSKIESFLLFYLLSNYLPSISFKAFKKTSKNFAIKLVYSKKSDLNKFLFTFFLENNSILRFNDFLFFKEVKEVSNSKALLNDTFTFNIKVPFNSFIEINDFLSKSAESLNSKELFFNINFKFVNPLSKSIVNKDFLIKNLFPFSIR